MSMMIDTRKVLTVEKVAELDTRFRTFVCSEDCDGRYDRNARRRFLRALRTAAGCSYVTCYEVEHNPLHHPSTMSVAFGRVSE